MISYIHGAVQANLAGELTVIPENSGVGFSVQVAQAADYPLGATVNLYLHTHWNQEQGPTLYGFADLVSKQIFKLILSCPGLGPKVGLAILGQLTPVQFMQAVTNNDLALLSSVNGIGPKKAEQLTLALRTKVQKLYQSGTLELTAAPGVLGFGRRLTDTLTALNYGPYEIAKAVQYVTQQPAPADIPFDAALRSALAFLAKPN